MADIKKRKLKKTDWELLGTYIKEEFGRRESDDFRKDHERIWKEVDRQIQMKPMKIIYPEGKKPEYEWRSNIELGELSKVSEVVSADVMRIMFPQERDWFEAHVEMPQEVDEQTGQPTIDQDLQIRVDNTMRAFMAQQHMDFGFKRRFELSEKEALHHGSFVAEIVWESDMQIIDGSRIKTLAAPVWVPHSMWNCYPDPSPRVIGTNMFYTGSMIIKSYILKHKLKRMTGEGWMKSQFSKVPEQEHDVKGRTTKDVELLCYYGDLVVPRSAGDDIFLPNSKAVTANGVIVYWRENELPFPSVIYGGYEKQDVRDPYFTSPIIKQAPMAKTATVLANQFINGVKLHTEPPIVYDGLDPNFVENDGPEIAPGAKTPTKGAATFQEVKIGDPSITLQGLEVALRVLKEGTGVASVKTGVQNSDRQTATEVNKVAQGSEVRTVDFLDKLVGYIRAYLHMQHTLNVKYCKEYNFYSDDMDSPDFVRITNKDLKQYSTARFDVVGAKGILGEEQRAQRTTGVTAFASGDPGFAPLLKRAELLIDMYKDAGHKNPEKYVSKPDETQDPALQEAQQIIQQLQQGVQQLQQQLAEAQKETEVKIAAIEQKREQALGVAENAREKTEITAELKSLELARNYEIDIRKLQQEKDSLRLEVGRLVSDMDAKAQSIVKDGPALQ